MKQKLIVRSLFLLSLVLFFLLNHFTNIAIDDFAYKNIFTADASQAGERVRSLADLIQSMQNHYFITNGRIILNGIAQIFLMSDNKFWFDLANTFVFGLFQLFVLLLIGVELRELTAWNYILVISLLWFLLPAPNHTLLWLDGSLNYLWAATLVIGFIYLWSRIDHQNLRIAVVLYPLLFAFGFVAGLSHEVFSIGLSGTLFFYYLFCFKRFRGSIPFLVIGLFLGTTITVFAPGNMLRVASGGNGSLSFALILIQRAGGFIVSFSAMIAVWILFFVLLANYFRRRNLFQIIIRENIVWLGSVLLSSIFIILVGAFQDRVFFGISLFSIIVLLRIFHSHYSIFLERKWVKVVLLLLSLAVVFEYVAVEKVLSFNKRVFDQDEQIWRSSADSVFVFHEKEQNRFTSTGLGGMDKEFWSNKVMSWYYGHHSMTFISLDLYENLYLHPAIIKTDNRLFLNNHESDFYFSAKKQYLVIKLTDSLKNGLGKNIEITFLPNKPIVVSNLSSKQKVVKLLLGNIPSPVTEEKTSAYGLYTNHGSYLFFKAPTTIPLDYLKEIKISSK